MSEVVIIVDYVSAYICICMWLYNTMVMADHLVGKRKYKNITCFEYRTLCYFISSIRFLELCGNRC